MIEIVFDKTKRGFPIAQFLDQNDQSCSIQESSVATDQFIWFGVSSLNRMHLSRDDVAALLPLLQHFIDTGALPSPPRKDET